jgi:DNA-binding NarL/FixJ family response regulator
MTRRSEVGELDHDPEVGRTPPVRVLIVDDHPVVREGLRHALSAPDVEIVGEAATGKEALAAVHRLKPEILILDIRMPDMDGLTALHAIKRSDPSTAVIIFTSYEDPDYLRKAIQAGAAGYVLKATGNQELLGSIRRVAEGDTIIDRGTLDAVLSGASMRDRPVKAAGGVSLDELTKREMQILRCIRSGLTNAEIAELLEITPSTVKVHCYRLYQKLGVSDRTQALLWADRHGIKAGS